MPFYFFKFKLQIGHIATSIFWISGTDDTKHPDPFTFISNEDVSKGLWKSANPEYQVRNRRK